MSHDSPNQDRQSTLVGVLLLLFLAISLVAVSGAAIVVAEEDDTFPASGVFIASDDGPEVEIPEPIDVTDISYPDEHTIEFTSQATFDSEEYTNVTVDIIDGPSTSVTTHDVEAGLTIDPDDKQAVSVEGEDVDSLTFYDVNLDSSQSFDLIYGATDLAEITVIDIDAAEGETVEAIDLDEMVTVDSATVDADSTVTFDALPERDPVNVSLVASTGDIEVTAHPVDTDAGDEIQSTVQVTDGNDDPLEGVDVEVQAVDGPGEIASGTTDIGTDENGEAEFTDIVIEEAGTYALSFSAPDEGLLTSSDEFTISPLDPFMVDVTVTPDEVVADGDDEATFTVTVEDEFGNGIEGETVTVEEAEDVDLLDGIDPGDDAITDIDGEAEFVATATEVGDLWAEFSQDSDRSGLGTATFVAGPPDTIEITEQPEDAPADWFVSTEVEVLDELDNPVEGAVVELTADPPRIDAGETTIETNEDGEARFDDVDITEIGEYTFEYEVEGLTATSDPFTVEVGDPHELTVELDDDEYLANGTHEATFTVTVEDMFDNPVEGAEVEAFPFEPGLDGIDPDATRVTDTDGQVEFTATSEEANEYTVQFEEVDTEIFKDATVSFVAQLDPFEIEDWHDLDEIRDGLELEYVLVNDLDEDTDGYDEIAGPDANDGKGFEPIGDFDNRFSGVLYGDGHEVRDLTIDRVDTDEFDADLDIGLIGFIEGGSVEDIHLREVDITGHESVGGIAGQAKDGAINDSSVHGEIAGSIQVGGAVGQQLTGSELHRTHVDVEIEGTTFSAGGMVGNNQGDVTMSSVRGSVTGESSSAGGIVGTHAAGTVEQSYSLASVTGEDRVGGIAGESSSLVNRTYAAGVVSGDSEVGALIGEHDEFGDGTLSDSYWDTAETGHDDAVGEDYGDIEGDVAGLSTEEMTGESAIEYMETFQFGHVWTDTDEYPELLVEQPPAGAIESFDGETQVSSDDEPVEETYVVTLDEQLEGVTVSFDASTFDAEAIDAVSEGAVSDLVDEDETIDVTTDEMGEAELAITWSDGVDELGTLQASISEDDALVAADDMETLSLQIDTTPLAANDVDITGDFDVTTDDEVANRTYTVSVDDSVSVPVTLALDGFDFTDIEDASINTDELLDDGTRFNTDPEGEFEFWIEFAAGVDQSGTFTVDIDEDDHDRIGTSAMAHADITVDTMPVRADAIETINGESIRFAPAVVSTDNESADEEYVVRLNEEVEGAPVAFDASDFHADDIEAVNGEAEFVDDLVGIGQTVVVETDESGEATLEITWAPGVDASGDLLTSISEAESDLLNGDDLKRLPIEVSTELQVVESVSIIGQEDVIRDNAPSTAEYEVAVDGSVIVPVRVSLDGVEADDLVDEESDVDVEDLVGDGITISTNAVGQAVFDLTFAAGIDETAATMTAEIQTEDDERIVADDTDTLDLTVHTAVLEVDRITAFEAVGDDSIRTDKEAETGTYTVELNQPAEGVPVTFDAAGFDADDIDAVDGDGIETINDGGDVIDALVSDGEAVSVDTDDSGQATLEIAWAADIEREGDLIGSIDADAHDQIVGDDTATMSIDVDTRPTQADEVIIEGDDTIEAIDEPVMRTYTASIVDAGGAIDRYVTFALDEAAFDETYIESVSEGSVEELLTGDGVRVGTDSSGNAMVDIEFAAGADVSNGTITASIDEADDGIGASDEDSIDIDVYPDLLPVDTVELVGDETPSNSRGLSVTRTYTATLPERVDRPVTFVVRGDELESGDINAIEAEMGTIASGDVEDLVGGEGVIMDTDAETGSAELDIEFAGGIRADDQLTASIDTSDAGIGTDASDSLTLQIFTEEIEDAQYIVSDPIAPINVSPGDDFVANVSVDNVGGNATDAQDVIFLMAEGGADGDYTSDSRVAFEVVNTEELPQADEREEVSVEVEAPVTEGEYGYVFVSGDAIGDTIRRSFDDSGEDVIVVGDLIDDEPDPIDEVLDVSVEQVDGPPLDQLPDYTVHEEAMQIGVSLENPNALSWPQELAGLGVEDETVFEVTVKLEDFTPHMLVGTATDAEMEITEEDDGVTTVVFTASPSDAQYITEPEMPILDDWPTGDEDQADIAFEQLFDFTLLDLEQVGIPETERETANGTMVMTDAQAFGFSTFSAPGEPGEGELALEVGGPGQDVDGDDHEGFFDVFLPDAVLTEWGVEDAEAHLLAGFDDEDLDFQATPVEGGVFVEIDIDYSAGEASVEPDHPLAVYATDDGVIETQGLREAVDDWRSGEIETSVLRDVVDYWRSGDEISEG